MTDTAGKNTPSRSTYKSDDSHNNKKIDYRQSGKILERVPSIKGKNLGNEGMRNSSVFTRSAND